MAHSVVPTTDQTVARPERYRSRSLMYSQRAKSIVRFCPITPHSRPYKGVILASPIKYAVPSHDA